MTKTRTATCTRCHATLRSPRSITRGMGAHCARLTRQERAVADAKPATIEKARQLITDGAILPIRGRRVFTVIASNGTDRYLTAPQACNCPAGRNGRACYHRVAATMLAA